MTEEKSKSRQRSLEGGVDPAVPGSGDLFAKTAKAVCDAIVLGTQDPGRGGFTVNDAVSEVVQGSVRDAVGAGDSLVLVGKAIIVGVLRGTGQKEATALGMLSHTSRAVVRTAARLGGDLAASVKGVILGAIASAKDIGVDRAEAGSSAAQGTLEGAVEAGSDAAEKVREALKESIGGVKVALPVPLKR